MCYILNKNHNTSREFFDTYVKVRNEQKLKKTKLKYRHKKKLSNKILTTIAIILTVIAIGAFAGFNYLFGDFKTDHNFKKSCHNLGLKTMQKINDKIINIAIFGIDRRKGEEVGRSDAVLIATLDGTHKKIKLASLMRDSRVVINRRLDKLCHAYAYGGPELAVKTINQNFDLDIHDYMSVDFSQLARVIDQLGKLDILITKQEAFEINGLLNSTPEFKKCERIKPLSANQQVVPLTGPQAVGLARIRNIDSDIKRTERQQRVLSAIYDKIKSINKLKYPKLIKSLIKNIETSLSIKNFLDFLPYFLNINSKSIEKTKIPDPTDKEVHPGKINEVWYWDFDVEKYAKILHDFIFEKDSPKTVIKN